MYAEDWEGGRKGVVLFFVLWEDCGVGLVETENVAPPCWWIYSVRVFVLHMCQPCVAQDRRGWVGRFSKSVFK